ncbi:MAG: sialidase family protein [Kiritimatiellaeota bacterium]|nr:sialidase family protein [Kiritimatiellota bacterium]
MNISVKKTIYLMEAVTAGLVLAIGAGCTRIHWTREDFDGTKIKIPWYTPGANPRLTVNQSDGALHMVDAGTESGDLMFFMKAWCAVPAKGATVEARIKVVDCVGACGVMLMAADGVHEDALTLYKDKICLDNARLEYALDTTDDFHVYRLDIRGTDIAVSVDGKRVIDGKGKFTVPANNGRNCIGYGSGSSPATGEAYWDWLRWTTAEPPALKVPTVPGAEQVIVYKKDGVYACFPSLATDPDTGYLYSSFGTKVKQSHIDPTGGSACMESRDGGRTWQEVKAIPPTARGERPGSVFKAADGTLVEIGQYFWRRYPAEQKPELQKKYYIRDNCGPGPGKVATCTGGFLRRSTDGGKTWETTEIPELDAYMAASSGWSCCQLVDGTVLRAFMVKKAAQDSCDCYVVRTKDGKTYDVVRAMWDPNRKEDVTEENIVHVMNNGTVWMMARIGELSPDDFMWQAFSEDGGKTWRTVKTEIKGHPPSSVIRLQDGRLLLTYGYRHVPYGIRAVLSKDDGRTWQTDQVQVLRTDGYNFDLGYPYSVQLKDGTIVTVYYFVTADFITHIACTRWQAPKK